jgi:hypothetical protein
MTKKEKQQLLLLMMNVTKTFSFIKLAKREAIVTNTVFWDVTTYSPVKVYLRAYFRETSVNFYQTTRRHIPEYDILQRHADRISNLAR